MTDPPAPLRVLIVDDDEDQRYVLRRLLAKAGITEVHEAVDGAHALEVAAHERPDLVILDLAMPIRSGVDVLPELRELVPDAPVIVLSNLSRQRWEATVAERGAMGFVEKRTPSQRLVSDVLTAAALLERIARRMATELAAASASPAAARRFIRTSLLDIDDELLDSVELLVSELVTNAVIHASSAPRLELVVFPDRVRVEVTDDNPTLPAHRTPDEGRPGGRGLILLDRLSSAWGAEPADSGKVVWFEVQRA